LWLVAPAVFWIAFSRRQILFDFSLERDDGLVLFCQTSVRVPSFQLMTLPGVSFLHGVAAVLYHAECFYSRDLFPFHYGFFHVLVSAYYRQVLALREWSMASLNHQFLKPG
jgi:hypothetical protein|tara:strand:+ start:3036 stop:3368 length:333 start_codon:yes stop_codon:yes gene_type:complete